MRVNINRVGDVCTTEASGSPAELAEFVREISECKPYFNGYKPAYWFRTTGVAEGTYPTCTGFSRE